MPHSRETVLASCLALLIAMFGVTAFVTRTYHRRVHQLADQWYAEGESAFAAQNPKEAVVDFRNALVYSPYNLVFQFQLTQALIAAQRWDDAEEYLQNLLSETPGSGEINLSLARIAARKNSMADALRYYHAAIYGEWQENPIEARWQTRRELCEYLLSHHATNQAEAEVIALADNSQPGETEKLNTAGKLLLETQLWSRALDEFKLALASNRRDADALAGAGTAEFQMGHYEHALGYWEKLPRERRAEPGIAAMLEEAEEVEGLNPLSPGLTLREKARRTSDAVAAAEARVAACAQSIGQPVTTTPPTTDLQKLYAAAEARKREWSAIRLETHPAQMADAMSAALQMESAATKRCGEPKAGIDRVLQMITQKGENPAQ
jgi:tetratricopeptide (TPR) repeat protein